MATTPVTFESENANLTLQDIDRFPKKDGGVWAQFEDGRFTTDDPKVIELLDQVEGVSRAEDDEADNAAPANDQGGDAGNGDQNATPPA